MVSKNFLGKIESLGVMDEFQVFSETLCSNGQK